jgi:hypothetical protein
LKPAIVSGKCFKKMRRKKMNTKKLWIGNENMKYLKVIASHILTVESSEVVIIIGISGWAHIDVTLFLCPSSVCTQFLES